MGKYDDLEARVASLERATFRGESEQEGVEAQARANQVPSGAEGGALAEAVELRQEIDERNEAAAEDAADAEAAEKAREKAAKEEAA